MPLRVVPSPQSRVQTPAQPLLTPLHTAPSGSCEVWREDQGLLSRSGRKRRPPSLLDGGILWFFSNCGATVGFLTRYDAQGMGRRGACSSGGGREEGDAASSAHSPVPGPPRLPTREGRLRAAAPQVPARPPPHPRDRGRGAGQGGPQFLQL